MKRVDLALRIVAVALLAISVSGLAVRASDGTCATCTGWRGDLLVQGCPYTQVLDCWCESSIEICCLYEICQLGPGDAATSAGRTSTASTTFRAATRSQPSSLSCGG